MDELRARVEAVERALTDGEGDLTALAEGAARADRVEALADDVEALQDDVAELEAATQALRGYVGNVRSVNESVEERADGALAAVESLENRVEALGAPDDGSGPGRRHGRGSVGRPPPSGNGEELPGGGRADGEGGRCQTCGRPGPATRAATADGRGRSAIDDADGSPAAGPREVGGSPLRRRTVGESARRSDTGAGVDRPDALSERRRSARPGTGDPPGSEGHEPGLLRRFRNLL